MASTACTTIEADMVRWMEEHEYESVQQMQGSMSQKNVASPAPSSAPTTCASCSPGGLIRPAGA